MSTCNIEKSPDLTFVWSFCRSFRSHIRERIKGSEAWFLCISMTLSANYSFERHRNVSDCGLCSGRNLNCFIRVYDKICPFTRSHWKTGPFRWHRSKLLMTFSNQDIYVHKTSARQVCICKWSGMPRKCCFSFKLNCRKCCIQ